jgi:hypothetical protein
MDYRSPVVEACPSGVARSIRSVAAASGWRG